MKIWRAFRLILGLILLCTALSGTRADLNAYLKRPEPAYRWEKRGEEKVAGGTIYDLQLVSQTWQGIEWDHRLQLFRPDALKHPHFCTLLNTGGNGGKEETLFGMAAAKRYGGLFAILFGIPKQPLYGGLTEDALVVYTWQKYMETGDDTWPLHFPMAKAVLKAMDAIQAFAKQEKLPAVNDFLITGASKRGWTTWLAGASGDKRIKAIAPMVIDTLNLPAQIPHQLAAYGKPSEQVGDYTKADMFTKLNTPEGKRLLALEDPYSYRDRLTLPKLIILGTNDRYWAQDALNIYWGDLKGPKWISYTPNSGHGLEDREHALTTLTSFADTIASKQTFPTFDWKFQQRGDQVALIVTSPAAIKSARLFRAYAATQDFRDSKWTAEPMESVMAGAGAPVTAFRGDVKTPERGYVATFGEVTFDRDGQEYTLSTQIQIAGSK